jgi:hypothetical protein
MEAMTSSREFTRVAVLTTTHTLYDDLGKMIIDAMTRAGVQCHLFQDCSEEIAHWPVLLIIGDTALLARYDSFFRSLGDRKPFVILWYLEQLGPGNMSQAARQLGMRLADCYWPKILPAGLRRIFRTHAPGQKPHTNFVTNFIRSAVCRRLKKQLEQDCGYRCCSLDNLNLFYMMYRSKEFLEHFRNPWVNRVLTSAPSRKEHLEQLGIPAQLVPVGWHPSWGEYLNSPRDIDVVFLGNVRRRGDCRSVILRNTQKQLSKKGLSITMTDRNCYGQTRTSLLNRSKILIDIVRAPWEIPGMRLLIAMSCGAMVLSCGFAGDASPYVPGTHFINTDPTKLADTIVYYLEHEKLRQEIADAGRKWVTETVTLENSLTQILRGRQA